MNPKLKKCLADHEIPAHVVEEFLGDIREIDLDPVNIRNRKQVYQREKAEAKRKRKRQALADKRNFEYIESFEGSKKEALESIIGNTSGGGKRGGVSIEARATSIRSLALGKMVDAVNKYRPKMLGLSNSREGLSNIVRELFGHNTGDADAAALAKPIADTFEYLRTRWNDAGGTVGKLEDWGMPQSHDAVSISGAGYEEWATYITKRLDWERMEVHVSDRDKVLRKIFNNITNQAEELSDDEWLKTLKGTRNKAFVDKNSAERYLHFKDADNWIEYQESYGSKDIFGTILNHTRNLSDDIAIVETLGPSPQEAFQKLANYVDKRYPLKGRRTSKRAENRFNVLTGNIGVDNIKMAKTGSLIRSLSATSRAGAILISAFSDVPLSTMRALYSGLGASRALRVGMRQMQNILTLGDEQTVARMGVMSDSMLSFHRIAGRFEEDDYVQKAARYYSEFTFRASGLTRWTEGMKLGYAMEFSYAMGDVLTESKWTDLNLNLRNTFERYGISEKEFGALKRQGLRSDKGGKYLDPSMIKDREMQTRVTSMFREETRGAVLEPGLQEATPFQTVQAGTITGELIRSTGVFKSFALTYLNTVIVPIFAKKTPWQTRVTQAAFVAAIMPIYGWISYAAKQATRGEVPADPFEDFESFRKAYGAGFTQAGGLGIVGDFIFADENRFGGGLLETLAGPVAADATDMLQLVKDTMGAQWSEDVDWGDVGQDAVRKVEQFSPVTNLWYTRLPAQRTMFDPIESAVDPKWQRKQDRRARKKEEDGQTSGQWWPSGQFTPDL